MMYLVTLGKEDVSVDLEKTADTRWTKKNWV